MINAAANWLLMLAFIPAWAITANLWFGLASRSKRMAGPRTGKVLDGAAVALSLCSAGAILLGLKCGSFIDLPFSDQACHGAAMQLSGWLGF
jgi:hypothetical protein